MKKRFLLPGIAAITALTQAQNTTDSSATDPVEYVCGQNNADKTYATEETAILCLFFDQLDPP